MTTPSEIPSLESLKKKQTTLLALISVVSVIALLYIAILTYWAIIGKWSSQQTISIVPLSAMFVTMIPNLNQLSLTKKQIANHPDNQKASA